MDKALKQVWNRAIIKGEPSDIKAFIESGYVPGEDDLCKAIVVLEDISLSEFDHSEGVHRQNVLRLIASCLPHDIIVKHAEESLGRVKGILKDVVYESVKANCLGRSETGLNAPANRPELNH